LPTNRCASSGNLTIPKPQSGKEKCMPDWAPILGFVILWFVLQRWILPRLGVPT